MASYLSGLPGRLLVSEADALASAAFSLAARGQLVRLAKKTAASPVLRSLALVMRHEFRLARSAWVYAVCPFVYPTGHG
jgi:hypothetical protein